MENKNKGIKKAIYITLIVILFGYATILDYELTELKIENGELCELTNLQHGALKIYEETIRKYDSSWGEEGIEWGDPIEC